MDIKYTIDKSLEDEFGRMSKELARAVVGIVEKEFIGLLHNAPQRSGNYVANFAVAAGSRVGKKNAGEVYPPNPTNQQIVARGSSPAILTAMANNKNLKANLTNHITRGSTWWGPGSLTIYNKMDYADDVEGYEANQLREPNRPGVHAMQMFIGRLNASLSRTIIYGSPEFKALAASRLL